MNEMIFNLLNDFEKKYNGPDFIKNDPVQVPHSFKLKEDIEISAFLTATIAWGNRKTIIRNAKKMMAVMENYPHRFVMNSGSIRPSSFEGFIHRTFNSVDLANFVHSLRIVYGEHGGLESVFSKGYSVNQNIRESIAGFRDIFTKSFNEKRTLKHVSDVKNGSPAKRINLFLRWMVRSDCNGVDFGLWKDIPASSLIIPLDTHVASTARKLGLLTQKTNNWKAAEELTAELRKFDSSDPVRFDFALFGAGLEGF